MIRVDGAYCGTYYSESMDMKNNRKFTPSRLLPFALLLSLWAAGCASVTPKSGAAEGATESPAAVVTDSQDVAAAEAELDSGAHVTKLNLEDQPDVWSRIRAGFAMKPIEDPLVAKHEKWFVNNPEFMQAMTGRARLYLFHIVEEVEKRGIPTEIALLPAIESAYKPYAYSRAKAAGLWQFIPPTGRLYGLQMNWWYDGRRDVLASTQAALDYLEKLHSEFDGDWHLALAAYNAGEGKIGRMMEYNRKRGKPTDYQSLKLKRETINYVPKLQAMVNIVANPEKYGVQLAAIPNTAYFALVETDSQIDLGVAAQLAEMSVTDLHYINPAFTRFATAPDGPHHLLVPAEKKDALIEALNKLPKEDRIQYSHHAVQRGDTLHNIARHHNVSAETLRVANGLNSNLLRAGQDLVIPISTRPIRPAFASAQVHPRPVARYSASSGSMVHRVRTGDTLWSIARRYNVLVEQIRDWNLLEPGDVIKRGQRLRIRPAGVQAVS